MNREEKAKYWLDSAKADLETAMLLFDSGRYDWCLFLWHLVLEKTLKARIAQLGKEIPWIHNLTLLTKQAGIKLKEDETNQLDEIKTFNIEARYDDYKFSFHNKATKTYATIWIAVCKHFYKIFTSSLSI